uniref:BAG domain-containing protein n=1 Tax=Oryza glumipatula TaxID=40148 RepID=A0A0E0BJC9_9ORYZ
MASSSRRFFGYDPYDYYYTSSPYDYAYPYYTPAPAATDRRRHASPRFFPAAAAAADEEYRYGEPVETVDVLRPSSSRRSRARPVSMSVPVQSAGSETKETKAKGCEMSPPRSVAKIGREAAAVRVQAAARGFLARRMVREVRAVEAEAEGVARKVAAEAEALRRDARGRVAVGEALMRLLLRLDAVHGAREYRRRVTKRVLALQDAVDALEHVPAAPPVEEEEEEARVVADDATPVLDLEEAHDAQDNMMTPSPAQDASQLADDAPAAVDAVDMEENEMAPGMPDAAEQGVEAEPKPEVEDAAPEAGAEMEVDGGQATGGEAETEKAVEQVVGGEMQEPDEEAEGEWEMVTAESSPLEAAAAADVEAVESSAAPAARVDEPAGQEEEKEKQGVEMKKVLEMVAALCERSAQQCAVIGALAERVDALERAVRRVEESDRRRRRNKKLKKEAKANSKSIRSCYSD